MYTLSDFDFALPADLIAQTALAERTASRLLVVDDPARPPSGHAPRGGPRLDDRHFGDLPGLVAPGDLLVFNDTRVIKARFFGNKASGGAIEVVVERILDERTVLAQVRASKSPRPGSSLRLSDAFEVQVGARAEPFHTLHFPDDALALIERHGKLPLPPYISHEPDASDETRYQTVFAKHVGAVAAPTAGLHFDQALLDALDARGVRRDTLTLHVGAGTFSPVRTDRLDEHRMHSEWYRITPALVDAVQATRERGGRIVAVGTTVMRALEAAARDAEADGLPPGSLIAKQAETDIFITPGYRFRVVDRLITNFHLPKSTLLMLVSAFAGFDAIRAAYAHAIDTRYRFFSYGDAMLLSRAAPDAKRDAGGA